VASTSENRVGVARGGLAAGSNGTSVAGGMSVGDGASVWLGTTVAVGELIVAVMAGRYWSPGGDALEEAQEAPSKAKTSVARLTLSNRLPKRRAGSLPNLVGRPS